MITYTDRREINDPDTENIPYIYQGDNLETKEYMLIDLGFQSGGRPAYLAMKYNGLLTKIIDYGFCSAYMYAGRDGLYQRPFIISANDAGLDMLNGGRDAFAECAVNASKRNTIEIQYLLLNMYEYMYKGIDTNNGLDPEINTARHDYAPILNALDIFVSHFYSNSFGTLSDYVRNNPDKQVMMKPDNEWHWIVKRNVGVDIPGFEDPVELVL